MRPVFSMAVAAALLGGSPVFAQDSSASPAPPPAASISPGPPTTAPRVTPPKVLTSPQPVYPEALKAIGAQGEVALKGLVRADGTLVDATVTTGSRVPELDQLALEAFRTWTFKPGLDADGKPMDAPAVTKIAFRKDSVSSMAEKTCAEFVIDQDWYKATWPEPEAKSPLYYSTLGLFTLMMINKGGSTGLLTMVRDFGPAWQKTYDTCRKKPDALYIKILAKAL